MPENMAGMFGGLGAGASLTGGLASIGSGIASGIAQNAHAKLEASMFEFNATIADLKREDVYFRMEEELGDYMQQVGAMIGSQKTGYAAQNVDVGSNVVRQVESDTRAQAYQDVQRIKNNARAEAFGMEIQAMDARGQADLTRSAGQFAAEQSILTGGLGFAQGTMEAAYLAGKSGMFASSAPVAQPYQPVKAPAGSRLVDPRPATNLGPQRMA